MSVKAGSFIHPGSSNFAVTGIGFRPQWGIFLATSLTSEDAWQSPDAVVGCIGFAAVQNSDTGEGAIHAAALHEIWDKVNTGGSFGNEEKVDSVLVSSPDIVVYVQKFSDGGVDGWSAEVTSFDADGFSIFSILTDGAAGKRIYYLLGDENFELVGSTDSFIMGSSPYTLGWQPQAFFGIGTGAGNGGTAGIVGRSLPTVVAGDWGEYTDADLSINASYRGLHDPDVNTQFWLGNLSNAHDIPLLEQIISGGVFFSSEYTAVRTDTTFQGVVTPSAGFGSGVGQMKNFILGSTDSIVGSFTPTTTTGLPVQIDLPFAPEAVVFFSPQEHRSGVSSGVVQGATGYGWCTDTDQALIIWGGYWNPPGIFQTNGLMSSSHCWVANCLDREVDGTVGTKVTMGSAVVNAGGFEYMTTENAADPGEVWPVLYWAFAPVVEAPGFFRII